MSQDSEHPLPEFLTVCHACEGRESHDCLTCQGAGFLYKGGADPAAVKQAFYRRREKEIAAKIAAGEYDEARDGPVPWQKAIYARCGGCGEVWKICNLPMSLSLVGRATGRAVCPGCGAVKNLFVATSKEAAEHGKAEISKQPKA